MQRLHTTMTTPAERLTRIRSVEAAIRELVARQLLASDGVGYTEGTFDLATLDAAADMLEGLASECRDTAWDMQHGQPAVARDIAAAWNAATR